MKSKDLCAREPLLLSQEWLEGMVIHNFPYRCESYLLEVGNWLYVLTERHMGEGQINVSQEVTKPYF